jgi:PPOX class probable F420-dependent enzyme
MTATLTPNRVALAPDQGTIPPSHRDLFERPIVGVFTSLLLGGQPHSSLVWVCLDSDGCPCVNTTLERLHARNLAADPRASLLVVDPQDTSRFVQVRGDVELMTDPAGCEAHLDALARRYTRHPAFYGFVYPAAQRDLETRVICRLHPRRVTLDAIHR